MTDHALLAVILGVSIAISVGGLVVLVLLLRASQRMVREAQRLTQETATLMEKL